MADDNPDHTYYGVGLVISGWESIEFEFSRLFSVFCNDPDGMSLREYGAGRIFRERLGSLNRKADEYFTRHPNQHREGRYKELTTAAEGFSARRHEVAHGVVINVADMEMFQERIRLLDPTKLQTVVIPPYYHLRSHAKDGMPVYAFNSLQLQNLALKLRDLELDIRDYYRSLLGQEPVARNKPLFAR